MIPPGDLVLVLVRVRGGKGGSTREQKRGRGGPQDVARWCRVDSQHQTVIYEELTKKYEVS